MLPFITVLTLAVHICGVGCTCNTTRPPVKEKKADAVPKIPTITGHIDKRGIAIISERMKRKR